MPIMQNNDPGLIKAAKRTIRAEVSLVVVILIITSWSVYALYKLTLDDSGTIFGFILSKSNPPKSSSSAANSTSVPSDFKRIIGNQAAESIHYKHLKPVLTTKETHILQQPNNDIRIIQELPASEQEYYNNERLPLSRATISGISHEQLRPSQARTSSSFDGQRLPSNRLDSLLEEQRQQRLINFRLRPLVQFGRRNNKGSGLIPRPFPIQSRIEETSDNGSLNEEQDESNSTSVSLGAHNDSSSSTDDDDDANQGSLDVTAPDRQVAVNDKYASELMVDTTTEAPINVGGDDATEESSAAQEEDDSRDRSLNSQEAPSLKSDEDSSSSGDKFSSNDEEEPTSEQANDEGSSHGDNDASLRDEDHAVDEAVDRMTQPSNGVLAHREEDNRGSRLPFDYENTVQFDDSASGFTLGGAASPPNRQVVMNSVAPGDIIARFATSQENETKRKVIEQAAPAKESDLQVDQNRPVVLSGAWIEAKGVATKNATLSQIPIIAQPDDGRTLQVARRNGISQIVIGKRNKTSENQAAERKFNNDSMFTNRQKRSFKKDKIKAPYEVDDHLSSLNFDILVGQATTSQALIHRRYPRSNDPKITGTNNNSNELAVDGGLVPPKYNYITTNDTNLQQLFSHEELLDALKRTQLPASRAPYTGSSGNLALRDQPLPPTSQNGGNVPEHKRRSAALSAVTEVEPATGNFLTDVADDRGDEDEGFAIAAAASGDNHHMSMKKKKKHERKEHKKKMSTGSRKGGHKKKKHKKEMKKYVKEKKFKGAKKGKKEAKGKGGQGGKKGKKLYKDKGFKKRGFKNVYHKEEFGQKKSYFDEFRDKDFKKKWKKFDDKYNYAQMKKWQAKDVKGAKKVKDHEKKYKKYDKSQWKKRYEKKMKDQKASSKKKKTRRFK